MRVPARNSFRFLLIDESGALKARELLSPGQRPGSGVLNEFEPCKGETRQARRVGRLSVALSGLLIDSARSPGALPQAEELLRFQHADQSDVPEDRRNKRATGGLVVLSTASTTTAICRRAA